MITGEVDDGGIEQRFAALGNDVDRVIADAVWRAGALMVTKVRANASGRPGPNVQTGDYRRSIWHSPGRQNGEPISVVSTNSPQARRLEYGYFDTDALGRTYRQDPLPHWAPASEEIQKYLGDQLRTILLKAFRG